MSFAAAVHARATDLVRAAIEMTAEAGSGHPSSAASLAHLVTVLMFGHMRFDPARPDDPAADRLVLSEGHACPIVYAAAAELGMAVRGDDGELRPMTRSDAMRLREIESPIDGHPNPAEGFPFFPAATGSLGQGLSVAAGMALSARLDRRDADFFCLIGDGESREGQIWEALDFVAENGLHRVLPIFNCNEFGQTGRVSAQQSPDVLAAKLRAFGFDARVIDGHLPDEIRDVLQEHRRRGGDHPPLAVIARTVKGFGVPSLQGKGHHGKPVSRDALADALDELATTRQRLQAAADADQLPGPRPPQRSEAPAGERLPSLGVPPDLDAALRALGRDGEAERPMATRDAHGIALQAIGHARPDVVVLDGDVGDSTRTFVFKKDADLEARFFGCGIAEQHLVSCAAGLAAGGKTPFAASFGKFLVRGYDQLELALIGGFGLKLVGSHSGATAAADGPSQMALADVGFLRALTTVHARDGGPLLYLLNPADARAAYALTVAMAEHTGAVYLRTHRPAVPPIYDGGRGFELGGHHVLAEGEDVLLVAWGYLVHEAIAARDLLARSGIRAAVVDLYSLPFDGNALAQVAERSGHRALTVEDNYGAGMGSAVADALAAHLGRVRVEQMFVRRLPKSARDHDQQLQQLGLSAQHVAANAQRLVRG